jgi:hypothetical protein
MSVCTIDTQVFTKGYGADRFLVYIFDVVFDPFCSDGIAVYIPIDNSAPPTLYLSVKTMSDSIVYAPRFRGLSS